MIEPIEHEAIDRVTRPFLVLNGWQGGLSRGKKGPMLFPLRALLDPALEDLDLTRRDCLTRSGRGHSFFWVRRGDAADEFTFFSRTANDGGRMVGGADGSRFGIQPQVGFAGAFVRAVAAVAGVGKDRADV